MRRRVRGNGGRTGKAILAAGAVAALALAGGVASPPARAASTSATMWKISYLNSGSGYLNSIAAFSPRDIWAVGAFVSSSSHYSSLILHWDGTAWHSVTIPGASGWVFGTVAGSSATDVWFFGGNNAGKNGAFRFDGTHWHPVAAPGSLSSTVVLSATNVWIAGGSACSGNLNSNWKCTSYLTHYNGSTWQTTSIGGELIGGVAASPSGEVLAVGNAPNGTSGRGPVSVFRWNGRHWYLISTPHPASDYMPNIAMDSGSDVWVDSVGPVSGDDGVLHWNGYGWKESLSYGGAAGTPFLAVDGAGGAWVGDFRHYTGGTWQDVQHDPSVHGVTGYESPVTAVPGSPGTYVEATALDYYQKPSHPMVLIYGPPLP